MSKADGGDVTQQRKSCCGDLGITGRFRTGSHMAFIGLRYTGSGAVPVDCTQAGRLIQTDMSLHSVLWNVTAGTSSVRGSLNTGKRPVRTKHHNTRVTKGGALSLRVGSGSTNDHGCQEDKSKKIKDKPHIPTAPS